MKKSYILKFDEVQGDYVIVEKSEKTEEDKNIKNNSNFIKKSGFFANFFFKNREKQNSDKQNEVSKEGFFARLDKEIEENKKQKNILAEGFGKINQVEIPAKEIMENDTPVKPKNEERVSGSQNEESLNNGEIVDGGEPTNRGDITPSENLPETPQEIVPTPPTTNQPTTQPQQPATTPQQPEQPTIVPPRQQPAQNNPQDFNGDSIAEAVQLLGELYGNFRVLNMIYQNLRGINNASAGIFGEMISNNIGLQGALLNIYYDVSGRNLPPNLTDSVPALPAEYQDILTIALSRVQGMRDTNLRLTRMFDVDRFNRVFGLIESTLAVQNDGLSNLRDNQNNN